MIELTAVSFLRKTLLGIRISSSLTQIRGKGFLTKTKLKNPFWFVRKNRLAGIDFVTIENKKFIQDLKTVFGSTNGSKDFSRTVENMTNTLIKADNQEKCDLTTDIKRTGVIAKKIGQYPLWLKNGEKTRATLLQVIDNHVIKYIPPEQYASTRNIIKDTQEGFEKSNKYGCLLVGAESIDSSLLTKEYCGLFKDSGVVPKKHLTRFFVSPESALTVGTTLNITHFKVGNYVDVRGKTIDRGFQGVIKRWGFKGMPSSHGVTKTHRRPGNIGGGGEKGRVWLGTKMPGHMGNKWRILRGLKILRINTKFNVMWVQSSSIAGKTNGLVYIYDTMLPLKRLKLSPPFSTCQDNSAEPLHEDIFYEGIHNFKKPTIKSIENKN